MKIDWEPIALENHHVQMKLITTTNFKVTNAIVNTSKIEILEKFENTLHPNKTYGITIKSLIDEPYRFGYAHNNYPFSDEARRDKIYNFFKQRLEKELAILKGEKVEE